MFAKRFFQLGLSLVVLVAVLVIARGGQLAAAASAPAIHSTAPIVASAPSSAACSNLAAYRTDATYDGWMQRYLDSQCTSTGMWDNYTSYVASGSNGNQGGNSSNAGDSDGWLRRYREAHE